MNAAAPASDPLVIAISSRALFDLEESHALFEAQGVDVYADFQRTREDEVLAPGIAFPLVRKLLALNEDAPAEAPRVEVILLSRNSSDTGLRVFNSIQHHGLDIRRATFTSGAPTWPYVKPFGAHLFLSANPESVRRALESCIADATIMTARAGESRHDNVRIALDGDAVLLGDETIKASRGSPSCPRAEPAGYRCSRRRRRPRRNSRHGACLSASSPRGCRRLRA